MEVALTRAEGFVEALAMSDALTKESRLAPDGTPYLGGMNASASREVGFLATTTYH